jgi:exopolysaccharide biosynthesis polyprenyl glycosylphosphotransferase
VRPFGAESRVTSKQGDGLEPISTKPRTEAAARIAETPVDSTRLETHPDERRAVSPARLLWRRRELTRRDSVFRRALGLADMAAIVIALGVASLAGGDRVTWAIIAVPPMFVLLCKALGLYDRDEHLIHKTTLDEIPALFGVATLTVLLLVFSDGLFVAGGLGRGEALLAWIALFLLLVCLRSLARWGATGLLPPERCLLVGDPVRAAAFREKLRLTHTARAELVGYVAATAGGPSVDEGKSAAFADLEPVLVSKSIDRVVLAPPAEGGGDELLYIIRELKSHGVKVSVLPDSSRMAGSSVEPDYLTGLTILGVKRFEFNKSSQIMKRGIDILLSATALIVLAPLFAAIAVAIKLDSPGPVLFRQVRAGRRGRAFEMLKFRSMVNGADRLKEELRHLNEAEGIFKIDNDPRVTQVGRVLRRAHLDELPQLINVLKGDMSLVGPRPLPLDEDEAIRGWYRDRLEVPPGISGYWQVLGSSRIPLEEMVKLDYLYIANWSVWGDVKLMLRTVAVVAKRRGM